jgi:hypothetical protein
MVPIKDFSPYQDMIDRDEIVVFGLRIVQYFDDKGNTSYKFHHHGDIQSTQILGLMDEVKLDLQTYFRKQRGCLS